MQTWKIVLASAWLAINSESSERLKIHYYEGYGTLPGFKEIVITNEVGYLLAPRGFCKLAKITTKDIEAIKHILETYKIAHSEFSKNDLNMVCEGGASLQLKLGDKSKSLRPPCREKWTASDSSLKKGMDELILWAENKFQKRGNYCPDGRYLKIFDLNELFGKEKTCEAISKMRGDKLLNKVPSEYGHPIQEALKDIDLPFYLGKDYPGIDTLRNINFLINSICISLEVKNRMNTAGN